MNAKPLFAAALVLAATAASAVEATRDDCCPASSLTRAEVKAQIARARMDGTLLVHHEATPYIETPMRSVRPREEVRAEARMAAHQHANYALYVGS